MTQQPTARHIFGTFERQAMEQTTEPDWKAHAIALAAAIQRFRNDGRLRRAIGLRSGEGYAALVEAWTDYAEDGCPILSGDALHG